MRDLLAHLYEWHRLMIHFVDENQNGKSTPFLPEEYNWRTIAPMNQEFWKKHQSTSQEEMTQMLLKEISSGGEKIDG